MDLPPVSVSGVFPASVSRPSKSLPCRVRFTLSFPPEGEGPGDLHLVSPSGEPTPVQTAPLARWDDGSTRWLDCQAMVPEDGEFALEKAGPAPSPSNPATAECSEGAVTLGNGLVCIILSEQGPSPVGKICREGKVVSGPQVPFEAVIDDGTGAVCSSSAAEQYEIELIENGPVRAVKEQNMLLNEPVWANNEYDGIVCLAREYLRGGDGPRVHEKLHRFARHAVEVDFISYSDHAG